MNEAASRADTELARLLDEYADRLRDGEAPPLEEFAGRHPEFASTFRQLATVLQALPATNSESIPELTGFRIGRELGRGGMGVVYEAVEEALGRRVALKALPAAAASDPNLRERFLREAQAAARLHHTNIVPVYGVGEQNGVNYYVMQAIDGVGLDRIRRDRQPALQEVAVWGRKIADALAHAHSLGVLHRDVKPSNVLIDAANEPYLTDFGLAKLAGAGDLTGTGDFIGTLRYAAPEQLRDHADERSDVYSLGATLYELLAGTPAFAASDRTALLRQIADAEPQPLPPGVPRDLAVIVRKAMAKESGDRYASAADLAADLRRYEAGEPIAAMPLGPWERMRRWARRHPAIAGLSAAVAALLLAVAGVSVVGYVRTSSALKAAEKAQIAESDERRRAERGEQDARQALAQTLLAINKAHTIVDAIPSGYFAVAKQNYLEGSSGAVRRYFTPGYVIVTRIVELYEEFLRTAATEPGVRLEQARSWRRLGFLHAENSRHPAAEQAYAAACEITEELVRGDPGSYELRRDLAVARGHRGVYLILRRRGPALFDAALAELDALAAERPDDSVPWSERSDLCSRCAMWVPGDQNPEVRKNQQRAIDFQRQAVARSDTPAHRERLNTAWLEACQYSVRIKQYAAARTLLREWSDLWPASPEHVLNIALVAGDSLSVLGRQQPAIAAEEIERWKLIAYEHLERYANLGGTQNETVKKIRNVPSFAGDARVQSLLAKIPPATTPAAKKP